MTGRPKMMKGAFMIVEQIGSPIMGRKWYLLFSLVHDELKLEFVGKIQGLK